MHAILPALSALVAMALSGCPDHVSSAPRTLVAVFAHPDDELLVGPLLAAEARQGVSVHLILVTAGEHGTTRTKVPSATLGNVRTEEARCSARALGIEPPVILGFEDGGLGRLERPAPAYLQRVATALEREFARLRPDAIVTFGPEGGDGHPDHRLVSSVVSQVVQAQPAAKTAELFYAGFPAHRVSGDLGSGAPWLPTDTALLTTRVPYLPADVAVTRAAIACHKTQIPPDEIESNIQWYEDAFRGYVYLRPSMTHGTPGIDLFR
jgi:LmbE family N-acetylglucosaminyl deacetylase